MPARVSVVVPAFNNAEYISETMDSILAQTYRDFELIVADHASTDETWARLQPYVADPRVRLLTTEAGGGAQANWNRVSAAASGSFIKLVCGDDLIAPTSLERQVAALDAHPSAVLAASRREIVDASGRPVFTARGLRGLDGLVPGRRAIGATVRAGVNLLGEPACVLMRTEALAAVHWWDGEFPYVIDQATYARVLLGGDLVAMPDVLASFRLSTSQWSVSLAREQADQVVRFHASLAARDPALLSRTDVAFGNFRARAMSRLRRLVYVTLRRRMRKV